MRRPVSLRCGSGLPNCESRALPDEEERFPDGGRYFRWHRGQRLPAGVELVQRFLGAEPTFYPNDIEAVWELAEDRYVYLIRDLDRAGGAVSMIWVDDPVGEKARIAGQGIEPDDVEKHDGVVEVRVPRRRRQRDGNRWTSCVAVGGPFHAEHA